ncbi:hypothetical protein AW14_00545 [Siansivirga zeaxanthinifaciens CC-SAMT-1]|uniref:Uncharacterized protein n=1 Tax=Siansivirga zeaxanthinifaciens CC-SAMT-1 TaxID=1454006 RepID=A0A0C5W0A1_9FLAO|nr:hypothetical protein AW14_00330 [Siansivirga zeaxanthinifaciens CC-SAMT-1]AJR04699.1 hypothetical protein AW14_00545 [Siansivirga zeaxanthinifaciens CC-SAMT-1]
MNFALQTTAFFSGCKHTTLFRFRNDFFCLFFILFSSALFSTIYSFIFLLFYLRFEDYNGLCLAKTTFGRRVRDGNGILFWDFYTFSLFFVMAIVLKTKLLIITQTLKKI